MRLFIAEKPSMAAELAKILPNPVKQNGYYETGAGRVTWVYGHILQQADPGEYDEKYEKWRLEDLPIFPHPWKLNVAPNCSQQFGVIRKLLAEASEIIHAGDPDREGQLLIDEILEYIGSSVPVKRLLLNALDTKSIRQALGSLRDNRDFFNLQTVILFPLSEAHR